METYKFIDGIHACMILSCNVPNAPGPEYVLADDAKDIYKSGRDKGWSAGYHEGQVELASCISAKDARIAEFAAEVARENESIAQYQEANLSLSERLRSRDAEVAQLRESLKQCTYERHDESINRNIARNALKEG